MLSATTAAWATVALCVVAAALEGVCAGRNVRGFFETLRFPRYSAPLWVWSIIGLMYYGVFGFVVFRLLSAARPSTLAGASLTLIVAMMCGNAMANLVIFPARNLHPSNVTGQVFAGLDLLFGRRVVRLDFVAAAALVP